MPTKRQKDAFNKLLENPRSLQNGGIGKIMEEVGYKHNTAIAPSKNLTNTKGWKELCEQYLPDDELVKIHRFGLYAYKRDHSQTGPDEDLPDFGNIHKFLETAYKLKKYIGPDNQTNILNQGELSIDFTK